MTEPFTRTGAAGPSETGSWVERLRLLNSAVLQSKEPILITDAALEVPGPRVVFVNPAFTAMTGYAADEIVGRTPRVLQGAGTDRAVLDRLKRELALGGTFEGEAINYRKDGTEFIMEWQIAPIRDEGGTTTHYVSIQRDITERRRAERLLQDRAARDAGQRRRAVIRDLAAIIVFVSGVFAVGHIYNLFDPLFVRLAFRGDELSPNTDEVIATIVCFGLAMVVFSYRRWREGRADVAAQAQIAAALGFLHGELEAKVQRRTTEIAAANAELRREIAERVRAESVIKQFPAIVESSDDAILSKTPEGIITSWNAAAERMFGYAAAEVIGRSITLLFPPDRLQEEDMILAQIRAGIRVEHFETVRLRRDGRPLQVSATISPIKDAVGRITGVSKIIRDITERKLAEEQLRWRTAFFEAQVNSAPDGILVVDSAGKTILENQRMADLWQFPADIAGEQDDRPRLDWVLSRVRNPQQFAARVASLYEHTEEVGYDELELVDGRVFDRYSAPVRGRDGKYYGRIWYFRDSTGRQRAQEQITEQAALLDKARDAILVRGLDGVIQFWNQGAERMYGWKRAEAVGRNASELLYADAREFVLFNGLTIAKGEWSGELRHRTKDGPEITVEARWTLIRDAEGRPKSVLAINTDVTERKKIEAQFLRAQRMESIGTLAGGVAHDLNNILAPIMMSIELLRETASDPRAREILRTIEVSARRGADIVRQVLSFARGMEGERIEVRPDHLLKDLENITRDTFPKDIRMSFAVPPDAWTVMGDPTQMHQILLNLCVNARDAMPNGGALTVAVENCTLDEQYAAMNLQARPGRYVVVSVTDSGTGIPRAILDKIFEPFFTTKDLNKGTGLGLSTVMAIVKSHEGFVNVYSEPNQGTTFKVYLPAAPEGGAAAEREEEESLPRGQGETVLVVDDEASILTITSQTLQAFGYKVLTAANGADALAVYVQHQRTIAVVLTDMMMPVMDGPAAIHALLRVNPGVKIIAASGLNANGGVAKASGAGIRHFLPKPYTAGTLLTTIRAILDES